MSGGKSLNLSKEEEEELRQIFNLVDVDRGGSISQEELSQLLETLGMHVRFCPFAFGERISSQITASGFSGRSTSFKVCFDDVYLRSHYRKNSM